MKALLRILVALILAGAVAWFAAANRGTVTVSLSPAPLEMTLPVYLAVLSPLSLGLIFGALLGWSGQSGVRRDLKATRRENVKLAKAAEKADDTAPLAAPESGRTAV